MSTGFLTSLYERKDLLKVITDTFSSTISNYTQSTVVAKTPILKIPTREESLDQNKIKVAGLIRYESKDFGLELILKFPTEVLFFLYENCFQEKPTKITPDVKDLSGELLNIAFGSIDPHFAIYGIKMRSSFPKTFSDESLSILLGKAPPNSIHIPMNVSNMEFYLDIYSLDSFPETWSFTPLKK